MKKSLLLLASMLMSAASFAQWTQPVPAFVPMADDGETIQYLYNVEAGGFLVGANDWGTRASLSFTNGHAVKMTAMYEDDEKTVPLGTWGIKDAVKGDMNNWQFVSPDGWNGIWIDGGRAGFDQFNINPVGDNKYTITHNSIPGFVAFFQKFNNAPDTRLYFFSDENEELYDNSENPRWEGACTTWAFVTEEEYAAFQPKIAQYASAVALGKAIDEAKESYSGINVKDAEAIYGNLESTVAELDSATNILVPAAIVAYQKNQASADNPADFTDLVPSHDFENGIAGWSFTTGAQNKGLATNKADQNAYPGNTFEGQFLENWNPDPFAGKIYTQLTGLPAGVYKLTMAATANGGKDTWIYANDARTRTNGVDANGEDGKEIGDIAYTFSVFTQIEDGDTLEIGLENRSVCCNWIGIDNVNLTYYGAEADAYKFWYQSSRQSIITTMDAAIGPDTHYDKTQKEIFNAALTAGDAATSKEEYIKAVETLAAASDASLASVAAYADLEAAIKMMQGVLNTKDVKGLIEYFGDVIGLDADDNGEEDIETLYDEVLATNGGDAIAKIEFAPNYILEFGVYTTEKVKAYTEDLQKLFDFCIANSVSPGDDYTYVIKDADFTDPDGKGWTREKGSITWRGGFHAFPVAESYHSAFNFYQEVSAPDGIYSLSLNGFCRPDDGETVAAGEIYMNDFSSPFMALTEDPLPEEEAKDGYNCYLTSTDNENAPVYENPIFAVNGAAHNSPANNVDRSVEGGYIPDGMEGASVAFSADRYKATVYGIVEGGKMKIGARCTSTHQWVLWGNFKLTYEGKTEKAVSALAETFIAKAKAFMDENADNMTSKMFETLDAAITATEEAAGDPDAQYDAIIALNKIVNTEAPANIKLVTALQQANEALTAALEEYESTATEEAIAAASAASEKYESYNDMSNEEIIALTEEMNAATAALKIPADPASDDNPVDFTQVIINSSFDTIGDFTGWNAEGSSSFGAGGTTSTCAERFNMTFNTFQDIVGLPEGTYGVKVQGFYRHGSHTNDYNCSIGEATQTIEAYLYAEATGSKASAPLPLISTGAVPADETKGGSTVAVGPNFVVPNSMEAANYWFGEGFYQVEEIIVKVAADGKLRIGVRKNEKITDDWVIVDNFELWYYGNESKKEVSGDPLVIAGVNTTSVPVAIYSVSGAKIASLKKGINIVKGADGSVRKIFVK